MPRLVATGLSRDEFEKMKTDKSFANLPSTFERNETGKGEKQSEVQERGGEAAPQPVSFFGLFRFANAFDWICILTAMSASLVTGFCQIYLMIM